MVWSFGNMPRGYRGGVIGAGVVAALVGVGLWLVDSTLFVPRLLSSLLGVAIMVAAVLWLISGLQDRRKEAEWETARDVTYIQVADMMLAFPGYLCGPLAQDLVAPLSDAMKRPEQEGSQTLRTFADEVEEIDQDNYDAMDDPLTQVLEELPLAEESLVQLQTLLIPRILRLCPNTELHQHLLHLDDAIRRLRLSLAGYLHEELGTTAVAVLDHIAHYARSAAAVYEGMLEDGWTAVDLQDDLG